MTKIKFHDANLNELATLNAALSASRTERLNSNNVLNFTCRVKDSATAYLNENTVCSLDGDYYDVAFFRSMQQSNGQLLYDVQCEHVSYRLNNPEFNVEYFTMTGTPEAVLGAILDGTGFSVGIVEYSTAITISLQEAASRRGLLMYLVSQLGGDLVCNGFEISIVEHRGSATPKPLKVGKNVTVVSKSVNKRNRDILGNPIISYACDVYKGTALALGDVVTLDYDILGIDATLRVVEISYDPYNPANVSIEVGNLSERLEDDIYRIETETVAKNKTYYGTRIGPDNGFETIRNDKKARSVMNADMLAWQIGDGSGSNWTDMLYYDAASNKIKFTGDINMVSGSISWANVTGTPSIPSQYTDADALAAWVASGYKTYIDANGIYTGSLTALQVNAVDISADSIKTGTLTGITIIGGVIKTSADGERIEIDDANRIHFKDSEGATRGIVKLESGYLKIGSLTYPIKIESMAANMSIGCTLGGITYASGNWNFYGATVSGLTAAAVFS